MVVMVENDVGGRVRVRNSGIVGIVNTRITNNSLIVRASDVVVVKDNNVKEGSIRIIGNINATVTRNDAERNIVCRDNGELTSLFNDADDGENNCDLFGR